MHNKYKKNKKNHIWENSSGTIYIIYSNVYFLRSCTDDCVTAISRRSRIYEKIYEY